MNLPWYAYMPILDGLIGSVIGAYYHKQYQKDRNKK